MADPQQSGQATATVDYDALAQQHGGQNASSGVDYDGLASAHGGTPISGGNSSWDALKDKYGLPHNVDLSKSFTDNWASLPKEDFNKIDIGKFEQAYNEANPEAPDPTSFLGRSWDEAKKLVKGAFSESALFGDPTKTNSVAGFTPPNPMAAIEAAKQRGQEFSEHPVAATGATAVDAAALAAPFLPELGGKIWSRVSPAATIEEALSSKITTGEADTPRPGGQIHPALNNTPREVLQHAADEGIKLTPGQATESGLAQQLQRAGQTAAVGGKELASALTEQKIKFGQAINAFMDDVDPKRAGLSAESAGEQIRNTQSTAKSISHDNAAQGYQKIDYLMDKPINPQPISSAWNQVKQNLPMGAEESILAQTPRSMRAVVSDLLSGNPQGFKPTFAQGIQLRKFFRDMGDTDGLPSQTQAMFKQMSSVVDKAMESSAGTNADDWRAANSGWKDYATKYGNPQNIIYKIGKTQDPTRVVTMLTNAPATDILTVKQELGGAALEPLKRQVIQDIAQSRFNIAHDGIGGYSDSYLKALFSPAEVKELYLKGDLANRLKYDPNPSGTGSNLAATSQLTLGNQTKMSLAARMSMPRDPLSYLSSSPSRTSLPEPITLKSAQPFGKAASAQTAVNQ